MRYNILCRKIIDIIVTSFGILITAGFFVNLGTIKLQKCKIYIFLKYIQYKVFFKKEFNKTSW